MIRRWRLWRVDILERRKALLLDTAKFSGGNLKTSIVYELTDINYKLSVLRRKI